MTRSLTRVPRARAGDPPIRDHTAQTAVSRDRPLTNERMLEEDMVRRG
jgi:hypothetical protein